MQNIINKYSNIRNDFESLSSFDLVNEHGKIPKENISYW
jgi:hypothetical protein